MIDSKNLIKLNYEDILKYDEKIAKNFLEHEFTIFDSSYVEYVGTQYVGTQCNKCGTTVWLHTAHRDYKDKRGVLDSWYLFDKCTCDEIIIRDII
jgi:hypothetical protein